jgi:hypothetical protein
MRAKLGMLVTEATRLKRSETPANSAPGSATGVHALHTAFGEPLYVKAMHASIDLSRFKKASYGK